MTQVGNRRNLVLVHLESISWQQVQSFPEAFSNLQRVAGRSRRFGWFISSATSTQMALAYALHGNDFELEACSSLSELRPAGHEQSLFRRLEGAGYHTRFLALNARHQPGLTLLKSLSQSIPPVEDTNDVSAFLGSLRQSARQTPFALYLWNVATHVEQIRATARPEAGLDEQLGGALSVADYVLGMVMQELESQGLLSSTTIVLFGDHGDDFWTHGFQGGLVHGTAPYLPMIHTPLFIMDGRLPAVTDNRLVSMADLMPTCLQLLGLEHRLSFPYAGRSLLGGQRQFAFSQNRFGRQPDFPAKGHVRKWSVTDQSYHLVYGPEGFEFFSHRLDPGNHCNLLKFFELAGGGEMKLRPLPRASRHFQAALGWNTAAQRDIIASFTRARRALTRHMGNLRAFAAGEATGGAPP